MSQDYNGIQQGSARLFLADLDNNGALDLAASGTGPLSDLAGGRTKRVPADAGARSTMEIFSVADLDDDGQLDLVGLSAGRPCV